MIFLLHDFSSDLLVIERKRMKWTIPIILLLLSGGNSALFAQTEGSTTISVTTTVQGGTIELMSLRTMNLIGAEPVQNLVTISPVTSGRSGKMVALGNPEASFRMNYDRVRELVNTEREGMILIEYEVAGNPIDEQESAEIYQEETRELEFGQEGEFFIWIGGQVNLSNATPGNYEGEFTLEIEYN